MSTADDKSVFAATARLADRVLGGSVVFFIGAGFSRDSEGNTAEQLIARLLARLLAMAVKLAGSGDAGAQQGAADVLNGLRKTFKLEPAGGPPLEASPHIYMTRAKADQLAREYYNFNDWARSALALLSGALAKLNPAVRAALADKIAEFECELWSCYPKPSPPLERPDWTKLGEFDRDADRGKALFLDTMGFASSEVMAGKPRARDLGEVAYSYDGRLRPRHHALARLAREGWLPTIVTTNYDLLLEGGLRLTGLTERGGDADAHPLPATSVRGFSRVAAAAQFFSRGESYRTALLVKIHGCVDSYRDARKGPNAAWAAYLPALVFTYREIQTWRADAWSRDLLRTLLRTHTLALCGYSAADPVMHSTFREVYEEMALERRRERETFEALSTNAQRAPKADDALPRPQKDDTDAPLFFFDVKDQREFHGFEVLRAATEASGAVARGLMSHPNHIEFAVGDNSFPTIDDHLQWLVHTALRRLQAQALRSRLRRLVPRMLGHLCPDKDLDRVCADFDALARSEAKLFANGLPDEPRPLFESIVGWTWNFLPGLLRELALAELVESEHGAGRSLHAIRRWQWYFPATERPDWTAWTAVVELALRRMIALWREAPDDALTDLDWVAAEDSPHAAVSFARDATSPLPYALCIRLGGYSRPQRGVAVRGAFRNVTAWELGAQDVPWRSAPRVVRAMKGGHSALNAARDDTFPAADTIWEFALGSERRDLAMRYLGVTVDD